ncbi:UDP-glycosyltransferase UGT5-like [Cylas formicarius]|uniref:UDP-glycosyltransferase UGT5-like n=1 Tax=Cylas formicarius TaxID=197179 RepID=UPI0029585C35|nr:UDP-glycosyltransferase UGT5-like [Cylas formicarius]
MPVRIWRVALFVCAAVQLAHASRILFATGTPAPAHQKVFQPVWKELSLRGHQVHVLTPNPLKNAALINLTEYDLSDIYKEVEKAYRTELKDRVVDHTKPNTLRLFTKEHFNSLLWSKLFDGVLGHRETQRLLKENLQFDVAIIEWLFPTMAGLGAHYGCPTIGIMSFGGQVTTLDTLGNPSHPILAPDVNLPFKRDLMFKERLVSFLHAIFVRMYYHWAILPREDAIVKKHLGEDMPYLGDIERNVSLLLLNTNLVFHRQMPLLPNVVQTGGISFPKHSPRAMSPELSAFLDNSKNGVIYCSFGTSVRTFLLPSNMLDAMKSVFSSLPYGVVLKWENGSMYEKPENVFIADWIPQTAVLEHPNTKLFITQGGLQSIEEAIAAHVPILGVPFHSDQMANVDACDRYGMGELLEMERFTFESLRKLIVRILNDHQSYVTNAKKLDELMSDRPADGLEKAIWWIEYVIRHKGAKHMRNSTVDMSLWQYFMLDIIGTIVLAIVLLIGVFRFIWRSCKQKRKSY